MNHMTKICAFAAVSVTVLCARPVPPDLTLALLQTIVDATARNSTTTTTTITPKKTFITAAGNNGGTGGVAATDALCMGDGNHPGSGTYKALIADGAARVACTSANCGGGTGEHTDWVFTPDTRYARSDGTTLIFTTNANGVIDFGSDALDASFGSGGPAFWTGLNSDWTNTAAIDCANWMDGTAGSNGQAGNQSAVNGASIASGTIVCTSNRRFLCVEQ